MPHVKHKFTSAKADGIDSTLVKPSNWNAEHDLTLDTPSVLGAKVAGPAVELPLVTAGSGDDGSIWTKQAIIDAIAAAIAALPAASVGTGDVTFSMADAKPGWLFLNGQTIGNVGSSAAFANASAQALFTMFWNTIGGRQWPIQNPDGTPGAKGATADADWIALKKIALPDGRGRTFAVPDNGAGVLNLQFTGDPIGEQTHSLNQGEMPNHQHAIPIFNNGIGGGGGGASVWAGTVGIATQTTGGDGSPIPGPGLAHNNVQPTLGMNAFIKL
jgi:microcystin-dependent protein